MARTSQNTLLLQLFAITALSHVHSFSPMPTASQRTYNTIMTPRPALRGVESTLLYALASPPAEEEKNKNKKDDVESEDSDWTLTKGGFLPNLGKRRRKSKVIQDVYTMEDYKTVVVDEQETMVVVRFFAPWCRACKAVAPMYEKLANEYSPSVKFVQVPLTKQNAFLHEGLGVRSHPFAHIYHPTAGLVEEMSMNKRVFHEFRHILETYIDGSCDAPCEDFE